MEEIFRETAMAYYNGGSEELKQDIKKIFNELDKDRDGRISLRELRNGYKCRNEEFVRCDGDNNGTLDFQEFITFYFANKISWRWCDGCGVILTTFFACVRCFDGSSPFNLCCECYGGRTFTHNHSDFVDNHTLLGQQRQSSPERDPMESLREIATTYYKKGSQEVKQLATEFFNSMDINRDGQISLDEFLSFMRQEGCSQMSNPYFFKVLDKDGNNALDFTEVLTLYYVMRSGRRFCGGCGCFLDGMYLTCVSCFETDADPFCVCFDCYRDNRYNHKHSNFWDNFALLEMKRQEALEAKTAPKPQYGQYENAGSRPSSSLVIYQEPKWRKTRAALQLLNLAASLANASVQIQVSKGFGIAKLGACPMFEGEFSTWKSCSPIQKLQLFKTSVALFYPVLADSFFSTNK
ncbi:EF-hand domain [Dillenia turbinata]|uniref:EF-hand domain n=1 Tax=Dillenia turbinata TaxID=194707 RepID=A0AAN8UEW7_9MAGN